MKTEEWYGRVEATDRLTQGDLISECPVLIWNPQSVELTRESDATESLKNSFDILQADVVVMTQACDLDQEKVSNVILCPHLSLDDYRNLWAEERKRRAQSANSKDWSAEFNQMRNGFRWNLALLNEGHAGELTTKHRVVDFTDVFTIPRAFLESLLRQREKPRLRLRPPYREHLSQAFARFFMRVGLPIEIAPPT
jgi:hypothetical protein